MDLAVQVVGDYDHVLQIARIADSGGAVRDRFGQYAAAGVERVYIQLATRVADHAAECREQFKGT